MNLEIKVFHGEEIANWIDRVANLRISEFKEFPYLYVGNLEIEKQYLTCYAKAEHSILALAFCDKQIVGLSTGIPFSDIINTMPGAQETFEKKTLKLSDYYYCGEFIVAPQYRNLGIAKKLFHETKQYAKVLKYKTLCLLTVEREDNHLLKPTNYQSTNSLWQGFGFTKSGMKIQQTWPTCQFDGNIANTENSLYFWFCELQQRRGI